jgi:hypothetical protein
MFGGPGWEAWKKQNLGKMKEEEVESKVQEIDPTTGWRFGYLCGCGFDPATALKLAESSQVDLREVDSLLEKGCPHEVAVEILL